MKNVKSEKFNNPLITAEYLKQPRILAAITGGCCASATGLSTQATGFGGTINENEPSSNVEPSAYYPGAPRTKSNRIFAAEQSRTG